jgi:hypothetical protein
MKARNFFRKSLQAAALTAAFILSLTGCTKDKEECQFITVGLDKVNDLVAYLDPSAEALYAVPSYQQQVLDELQSEEIQPGVFFLPPRHDDDVHTEIIFKIIPTQPQELFQIAQDGDARLAQPDLVSEFEQGGVRFRVYKNAQCGQVRPGFTGPCATLADGSSTHNEWLPVRNCEAGDGFCTEVQAVQGYKHTYELKDCKGPRKESSPYKSYQCSQ